MSIDKTKLDNKRRELNFLHEPAIESVLPDYFPEEYPKFTALLKHYYDFLDSGEASVNLIHELFKNRDIVQTDIELLNFIEDELLLGQTYFKGFINKRAAAQYSSTLYRSKGTLFSIQQFFRSFFGITTEVVYTKENVFFVGESNIGPQSQKYLTDDKLYQTYALLIKSSIPIDEWKDAYKLFVHPAGMYVGAEIQIASIVDLDINQMPDSIPGTPDMTIAASATFGIQGSSDITGLITNTSTTDDLRISLPQMRLSEIASEDIQAIHNAFDNIGQIISASSATFDNDDNLSDSSTARFDQTLRTIDGVEYDAYDSDA